MHNLTDGAAQSNATLEADRECCIQDNNAFFRRLQPHNIKQELIVKAIGKGRYKKILDTTAGLGRDGLIMASVIDHLVMLERNPKIFNYLTKFFETYAYHPCIAPLTPKITLKQQCAISFLESKLEQPYEVIYCDPMFPETNNSALAKKQAQYLQAVVNHDPDVDQLVSTALAVATKRVIVKRPRKSPFLVKEPSFQYMARSHRFDVYLCTN